MLKRMAAGVLSVVMLFALSCTALAAQPEVQVIDLGDGFTMEIVAAPAAVIRASAVEHATTSTVKYNTTTIGKFTLEGRWTFNGSSAKATYASHDVSTYNGWDYKNDSSKRSGATVSGTCTFTKGSLSKRVSPSMVCSKDGKITTRG